MTDYRPEIIAAARNAGIDADLLEALVLTESGGKADAFRFEQGYWNRYCANNSNYRGQVPRRVASSYGLVQCMYPTAQAYGFTAQPEYLFLPNVNLEIGAKILRDLLDWAKQDVSKALEAYNGGKGNVGSAATRAYAQRVLAKLAKGQGEEAV
jgi:soluble lytic murein transglycosylase-like protein